MQPYEKMIDVLGVPLHVRFWGDNSAAHQILYWHGRGGSGLSINEAAPVLAEQYNARVISLDAPGFGQSPARAISAYQMPELALLVKELVRTLNLSTLIFVGHSWGGMVGCHVAACYPDLVKRLVLLDTGYMNPDDRSYSIEEAIEDTVSFYQAFRFADWESYLEEEKKHLPRWTEALALACRVTMHEKERQIVPIITPQMIAALERAYGQHPPLSTYTALKDSRIPILLLAATLPEKFHPTREKLVARFQKAVPQLEVQYLPATAHDVPAYRGPELAHDIGQWLNRGEV